MEALDLAASLLDIRARLERVEALLAPRDARPPAPRYPPRYDYRAGTLTSPTTAQGPCSHGFYDCHLAHRPDAEDEAFGVLKRIADYTRRRDEGPEAA